MRFVGSRIRRCLLSLHRSGLVRKDSEREKQTDYDDSQVTRRNQSIWMFDAFSIERDCSFQIHVRCDQDVAAACGLHIGRSFCSGGRRHSMTTTRTRGFVAFIFRRMNRGTNVAPRFEAKSRKTGFVLGFLRIPRAERIMVAPPMLPLHETTPCD